MSEIGERYSAQFMSALKRPARRKQNVNLLQHPSDYVEHQRYLSPQSQELMLRNLL